MPKADQLSKAAVFAKKHALRFRKSRYFPTLLVVIGVFVTLNLLVLAYYRERAYPHTSVGDLAVGGRSYADLSNELTPERLLPAQFVVATESEKQSLELSALGVSVDKDETLANIKKSRSAIPLWNLLATHRAQPAIYIDEDKLEKAADGLSKELSKEPVDAKIVLKDGVFTLEPSQDGYDVESRNAATALRRAVNANRAAVALKPQALKPKTPTDKLQPVLASLVSQQNTPLSFTYGQKSASPTPQQIGGWYEASGESFVLADSRVRAYVRGLGSGWGIGVENLEAAVKDVKTSIQSGKKLSFTLVAKKVLRAYKYCTALKGVDAAHLEGFNSKLASVYADLSGWSLDGQVTFSRVTSGCNFTAWLAAADQMTSFGGVCDSTWSCRIGNNVVINFDRWQNASSAWSNAGGSLEDYRVMVVNHETGHWLGFGHLHCSGAGQLAPVMQQQSINLEGCKFNPRPLPAELSSLRASLSG